MPPACCSSKASLGATSEQGDNLFPTLRPSTQILHGMITVKAYNWESSLANAVS